MVTASTWFGPYAIEVLEIPIAILLGTLSALYFKKVIIGPLIHLAISVITFLWIWYSFYFASTVDFFAVHMNDFESYAIEAFFIGVTWLLSWGLLKLKGNSKTCDKSFKRVR